MVSLGLIRFSVAILAIFFSVDLSVAFPQVKSGFSKPSATLDAKDQKNPVLHQIRRKLVNKKRVSFSDLRMLADSGDGLAAYRLALRIAKMGKPELMSDAAHYFSIAVFDGRRYAVRPLVGILSDQSIVIAPKRLRHLEKSLLRQARSGDARSISALARLYKAGTPFGSKPDEALALMKRAVDRNFDGEIALQLAVSIVSRQPLMREEVAEVERYLTIAAKSRNVGVRATAQNLMRLVKLRSHSDAAI